MSSAPPKHHLSEVDKIRRTAVCSMCGPTQIYVAKPTADGAVRVHCGNRKRETAQRYYLRQREKKRSQNPNWRPRHSLSQIDAERMIAICSVCGPIDIRKRIRGKYTTYMCGTKKRAYAAEYHLRHRQPRKPRQNGHYLSDIDDEHKTAACRQCGRVRIAVWRSGGKIYRRCGKAQNEYLRNVHKSNREFIRKHMVERGCRRCGYNSDPRKLELHRRSSDEKNVKIFRLVVLGRERLIQELAGSDVYCTDCHYLLHPEPDFTHRKHPKAQSTLGGTGYVGADHIR